MINGTFLLVISIILFLLGYLLYGRFLARKFKIDDQNKTPAHTEKDGIDYVPARRTVLLGHHFASIAGAAPIIGPVTAAVFGWLPVYLWIVLGGIFMGAVHDFAALISSVRHKAKSIGKVIEKEIGAFGKKMFLIFAWAALMLVIGAFLHIVASTFVSKPEVASTSALFIGLAIIMGQGLYRWKLSLLLCTIAGIILLVVCIYLGQLFPVHLDFTIWILVLMVYIHIASVAPVWVLLQPRDYLNSFLLYFLLLGALVGIFVSSPSFKLEAYSGFKQIINKDTSLLFPMLFVMVACGAISGFHSLVASGTTSKQLYKESDARMVGYGGMLIESLLAVIALIAAATITKAKYLEFFPSKGNGDPVGLFSRGVGGFLETLGIPLETGISFAALAVSAFALTSLDTGTRLARLSFQELLSFKKGPKIGLIFGKRYMSTLFSVAVGGGLALSGEWRAIWPLFGAANQLLAALALLAATIWLKNKGSSNWFVKYPMYLMYVISNTALFILLIKNFQKGQYTLVFCSLLLLGVSISMVIHTLKKLRKSPGVVQ